MPNSDLKVLGEKVRTESKLAGLTQEQLAERCHVSTKHIANIEKGSMNPSYEILLAIARVLPVSLDALITPLGRRLVRSCLRCLQPQGRFQGMSRRSDLHRASGLLCTRRCRCKGRSCREGTEFRKRKTGYQVRRHDLTACIHGVSP